MNERNERRVSLDKFLARTADYERRKLCSYPKAYDTGGIFERFDVAHDLYYLPAIFILYLLTLKTLNVPLTVR